jgi:predicted nucleic acid-binding protein
MYLLDTNVLSELRPGKPSQSPEVRAWAAHHAESMFFLSAITILELEQGILQLERRTPPQGASLRVWFDAVRLVFKDRVLPFTAEVAMRCAPMHVPDKKEYRDSMIAATAAVHGFKLVTRNTADFASTGVQLINPWKFEAN